MSNPISSLALPVCPTSTAVEEPSNHVAFQNYQDMPGTTSRSGMTSTTEVKNPPTHHNTLPETSPCRVTALSRDTICSSTTNSRPSCTVTTSVLSGGISSTLPPSAITSSTHYHTVVCNSTTCLGDRVITTPSSTPQGATSPAFKFSPPHHETSRPQQYNQAPREHSPSSSSQPVSREELHSAFADAYHEIQDMVTKFYTQRQGEMATPQDAQHSYNKPRRNTNCPPCQCYTPSSRERSPTPPSSPEKAITTRLHQEKMLQNLIRASEVKFDGKDPQDYAPGRGPF